MRSAHWSAEASPPPHLQVAVGRRAAQVQRPAGDRIRVIAEQRMQRRHQRRLPLLQVEEHLRRNTHMTSSEPELLLQGPRKLGLAQTHPRSASAEAVPKEMPTFKPHGSCLRKGRTMSDSAKLLKVPAEASFRLCAAAHTCAAEHGSWRCQMKWVRLTVCFALTEDSTCCSAWKLQMQGVAGTLALTARTRAGKRASMAARPRSTCALNCELALPTLTSQGMPAACHESYLHCVLTVRSSPYKDSLQRFMHLKHASPPCRITRACREEGTAAAEPMNNF